MKQKKLMLGNNIELLKKIPDNSIDSVVSDPPYGLSFMNKKWDYDVPSVEFWQEVLRVLKPGGHVLSFGGTRTYHRMVVNLEDAGFEIRDCISWLYGQGFPKSHNIGKAIDKLEGNEREVVGEVKQPRMNGDFGKGNHNERHIKQLDITKGSSPYEGWGSALKPAVELICVARKPLSEKSIAENVLKWGTGGINIDGCRIETNDKLGRPQAQEQNSEIKLGLKNNEYNGYSDELGGRFPANLILDEVAAQMLDEQSGFLKGDSPNRKPRKGGHRKEYVGTDNNEIKNQIIVSKVFDSGGASRFFYQAKVSKKERNMGLDGFEEKKLHNINQLDDRLRPDGTLRETPVHKNTHPTVKPVQLMAYLCRLITPENGIVLDPFMGSGSTGIAALLEGFRFCGMEMDKSYFEIAQSRIENYEKYREFLK